MGLVILWVVTALLILVGAYIVPGVSVTSFPVALIVAVVLGLLNLTVKPILKLITLPVNILTLGLFNFVINAFVLWLAASFVDGFEVENFIAALLLALVVGVLSSLVNRD